MACSQRVPVESRSAASRPPKGPATHATPPVLIAGLAGAVDEPTAEAFETASEWPERDMSRPENAG